MPDWSSQEELVKDSTAFVKLQHCILGVYAWEWFLSLDFDWDFITGKKKFRWPMIFYFANRYILLFALIGIAIALDSTTEINCQVLFTFNQIAGDAALGLASINLSLRTIAVYRNSKWIIGALTLVILGHWSLILQGVLLTAVWEPTMQTCRIVTSDTKILAATFIYSMAFDLLVFLLNAYALIFKRRKTDNRIGASRLTKLLFTDGLVYFFIAFITNLVATTFMLLNLNEIMAIIFNVPAAVANTMVACRVVRRLAQYASSGPEVFSGSQSGAPQLRGVTASIGTYGRGGPRGVVSQGGGGVHVQMETFTRTEDMADPVSPVKVDYMQYGQEVKSARDGSDTDVEYGVPELKRGVI